MKKKKKDEDSGDSSAVLIDVSLIFQDEDGDTVKDLHIMDQNKAMAKNSRVSVSAEVFGKYHKKENF